MQQSAARCPGLFHGPLHRPPPPAGAAWPRGHSAGPYPAVPREQSGVHLPRPCATVESQRVGCDFQSLTLDAPTHGPSRLRHRGRGRSTRRRGALPPPGSGTHTLARLLASGDATSRSRACLHSHPSLSQRRGQRCRLSARTGARGTRVRGRAAARVPDGSPSLFSTTGWFTRGAGAPASVGGGLRETSRGGCGCLRCTRLR